MANNKKKQVVLFLGLVFLLSITNIRIALAYPSLQLDILNGTYVTTGDPCSSETIVSFGTNFTIYALLNTASGLDPGADYYLSATVWPALGLNENLSGSFDITTSSGTSTIDVTEDMTYGTPTVAMLPGSTGDNINNRRLSSHGIFDNYFAEFTFSFDPLNVTEAYNSQDHPGGLKAPGLNQTFLFEQFQVDTSGLDAAYALHFDLYTAVLQNNGRTKIENAPFSHDCESAITPVPEPTTVCLMLSGLVSLACAKKKKSNI